MRDVTRQLDHAAAEGLVHQRMGAIELEAQRLALERQSALQRAQVIAEEKSAWALQAQQSLQREETRLRTRSLSICNRKNRASVLCAPNFWQKDIKWPSMPKRFERNSCSPNLN